MYLRVPWTMWNNNSKCSREKKVAFSRESTVYTLDEEKTTKTFHLLAAMHLSLILELLLSFNIINLLSSYYFNLVLIFFTFLPLFFVLLSSSLLSKLHCGQSQITLLVPKTLPLANKYLTKEALLSLTTSTSPIIWVLPIPLASIYPSSHITLAAWKIKNSLKNILSQLNYVNIFVSPCDRNAFTFHAFYQTGKYKQRYAP